MTPYADIMQSCKRLSGVLLHPTSLPSGKMDEDAFHWLDFMANAGLRVWQVLPLGVPQDNLSPYQCYSAFALNPALLSLSSVIPTEPVDKDHYQSWCEQENYWLNDYALFRVIKDQQDQKAWFQWVDELKFRDEDTLAAFREKHLMEIDGICWQQYQLYQRWQDIRGYAAALDIYLFGDMPIFVAHDSADVWANQSCFLLDDQGMPTVVSGVPPDYFSETGQLWGNPHYNWDILQANRFDWWQRRIKNHFQLFDLVRIDHFRGLEAVWNVAANSKTAEKGQWEKVLGEQLLQTLQNEMGNVPLVAEDLGIITEEVNALREQFHLPGMSVLQFSFDNHDDNPHKPQNITHDRVVYTGTHDNDTTEGWFQSLDKGYQQHIMDALNVDSPEQVTQTLINTSLSSDAQLAVVPLQDFLQLDNEARMNIPGTIDGNWQWQFTWDQIPNDLASTLRQRILAAGRLVSAY